MPHQPFTEIDIISFIFPSVITVLVALRFVLRRLKHERCYADDWIMCPMLGLISFDVAASRRAEVLGSPTQIRATGPISPDGKPQITQDDLKRATEGGKYILAAWLTYMAYTWCTKLCILIYYKRLTVRQKEHQLVILSLWALGISWVAIIILHVTACRHHVHLLWQAVPNPEKCIIMITGRTAFGIMNIVMNFVLIIIPLPMIYRTFLPLRLKIEISAVFAIGIFVLVFSILRLVMEYFRTTDGGLWALIECVAQTFFANGPIIHGLYRHGRGKQTQRSTTDNRSSSRRDTKNDFDILVPGILMSNIPKKFPSLPSSAHFASPTHGSNSSSCTNILEQDLTISTHPSTETSYASSQFPINHTPRSSPLIIQRTFEVTQTFELATPDNRIMVSPLGGTGHVETSITHHDQDPLPADHDLTTSYMSTGSNGRAYHTPSESPWAPHGDPVRFACV